MSANVTRVHLTLSGMKKKLKAFGTCCLTFGTYNRVSTLLFTFFSCTVCYQLCFCLFSVSILIFSISSNSKKWKGQRSLKPDQ